MAVQIKIPGVTFSGAETLPVVRADSLLPAAGALMLVDPTHPSGAWSAGVPANGGAVANIAWDQAAAALGSGTESSLAAPIYNVGLTSSAGLVERTTKGGLHGIISPTVTFSDVLAGLNVALPAAIYAYTRTNVAHNYYLSVWHRVSRAATAVGVTTFTSIMTDTLYLAGFSPTGHLTGTAVNFSVIDDTVGGPRFRNIEAIAQAGYDSGATTADPGYTPGLRSMFLVGNHQLSNGVSARRGKGGSRILYRAYLEDLTVSGRSYATVNALDAALYTAICNTAGGRYYGDTFTDPATIA